MNDLISKQSAMNALNHEMRCGAVINQCGLEVAYEVIEALPPAQPEPCEDAVSREAAIDALNKLSESTYEVDYGVVDCDDGINAIAALPPVTPKQSTGKWLDNGMVHDDLADGFYGRGTWIQTYKCSICGNVIKGSMKKYCDSCGTQMRL